MSALQKGETVLITGGTGWIGVHVANEALAAGFKVKLVSRSESKAKPVIEALEKLHGKGRTETVIVPDFQSEGAYDEAVKGVQGIVHLASDMSFSDDAEKVVTSVVRAYNSLLDAANAQKQVRRFAFTSSVVAIGEPKTDGQEEKWDVNSWNDEAVEGIKTSPNPMNVYSASKVLSERAAWEYVEQNKTNFTLTAVHPGLCLGAPVPGLPFASSGSWMHDFIDGKPSFFDQVTKFWHIDVGDVAKLLVLALSREDVKNERIFALGQITSLNDLIDTIKKITPDAATPEKKAEWNEKYVVAVDVNRANDLLKGQRGLRDLEYSVRGNLQSVK